MIINSNGYEFEDNNFTLLWENDSLSTPFTTTNIDVDLSKYTMLAVVYRASNGLIEYQTRFVYNDVDIHNYKTTRSYNCCLCFIFGGLTMYRYCLVEKNGVTFDSAKVIRSSSFVDGVIMPTTDNTYIIPYRIYGIY